MHVMQHRRRYWHISDAVADGIFIGVALFHLLPHAYVALGGGKDVLLLLLLLMLLGYALLFIVTRIKHKHSAWFLLSMLSLHAFITGSVLGIATTVSELLLVCLAILAHKGFETFALMTGLKRYWPQTNLLKLALVFFAFMTPLGIMLGGALQSHLILSDHPHWLNYLNGFAAGTLLFIAFSHQDHDHHDTLNRYQEMSLSFLGVMLMAVLALWV